MKTRQAAYAASTALLLGSFVFLTGCDLSGGGDGGGGGQGELKLAREDSRTWAPQYTDEYVKGVMSGAKPAADSSDDCGGRVTFDGDKKCKDQGGSTPVTVPQQTEQKPDPAPLQKNTGEKPKPKEEPPLPDDAACEAVLKAHSQMGQGTCKHHATTALVFAGARSVFTTRPDWKTMLEMGAGTAVSYALAALSGWGALAILAKIGYALLIAGGIIGFLSVMKDAWQADKQRRSTDPNSQDHAEAVWRESRMIAMLVVMLLSAVGPKAMEMLKAKAPVTPAAAETAAAAQAEPAAAASTAMKTEQKLLTTRQITDPRRLLPAHAGN